MLKNMQPTEYSMNICHVRVINACTNLAAKVLPGLKYDKEEKVVLVLKDMQLLPFLQMRLEVNQMAKTT